jgi:glycerol-3-phosphate cytidylyltransferase
MTPLICYTAGVFDLLHRGHINLLWRSRQLADILVVGVVSDEGTRLYKDRLPVENLVTRIRNVRQLSFVHVVVEQKTTDPSENLERFYPDMMTHGDDWEKLRQGHETLERMGIEFCLLPYTQGISTTLLREMAAMV